MVFRYSVSLPSISPPFLYPTTRCPIEALLYTTHKLQSQVLLHYNLRNKEAELEQIFHRNSITQTERSGQAFPTGRLGTRMNRPLNYSSPARLKITSTFLVWCSRSKASSISSWVSASVMLSSFSTMGLNKICSSHDLIASG